MMGSSEEPLSLGQKLVNFFFNLHTIIRVIQMYEPLKLKTMTGQLKMMQILCRGILSILL